MKIAIIGTSHPYRGGLASYNERMALEFQEQGHEVKIYTFSLQYPNFLFPGKSQYSDEPAPKNLAIERCINSTNPFNWRKVGKQIRNTQPDLVIIKFWLPFMGPCFSSILKQIKKNQKTKVITIIDNMIPHESRTGDHTFTKMFTKQVDGFIAMSKNVLNDINTFDTQKPRILSPHPLFDNFGSIFSKKEASNKLGWDSNETYILFFGLIRKYKGLDLLIEAFADTRFRNRNLKLVIAGEYYTDKTEYLDLIKKHQLENDIIHVDRFIPDSEVANYFNVCDLVVLPYKDATQSGITQIAYHFNKPMIVTDVGGLAEICPDGRAGYVVQPIVQEISEAILRFLDKTDKNQMMALLLEEKKRYGWDVLTKNIFKLLDKI